MVYNSIAFSLTANCNADCDICCLDNERNKKEVCNLELFKCRIEEMKDLECIETIGITGGEAFLEFDKLLELIPLIKKIGKKSGVITNGFWATDMKETLYKLEKLVECGLDTITISYDEFHEKYIKTANIINILSACRILNLNKSIQTVVVKDSNVGRIVENLKDELLNTPIIFVPCFHTGTALNRIKDERIIRNSDTNNQYCGRNNACLIDTDGTVWPCCSPDIQTTKLSVGNLNSITVQEAISKMKNNIYLYLIRNRGFDFFIDIARTNLNIEIPKKITSSCDLCHLFFSEKNYYKFYPYVISEINRMKFKEEHLEL